MQITPVNINWITIGAVLLAIISSVYVIQEIILCRIQNEKSTEHAVKVWQLAPEVKALKMNEEELSTFWKNERSVKPRYN